MVTRQGGRYWAWALGAVVLGLAGYIGYVLYPRFDLPAGAGAGLLVLATAAGVASFFSPCSFPLMSRIVAISISPEFEQHPRRLPIPLTG